MFELSVACKYLLPRRRQLSVSIISSISILVIALVVWLVVVFFSVTNGLEKSWVEKLTALTAPVRLTPTDAYYNSYYYLIDSVSEASNYSYKTLREKRGSTFTDSYNPTIDEELPHFWPSPDRHSDGSLKDLVKLIYASLEDIRDVPGLKAQDFELTSTHIQLHLWRNTSILHANNIYGTTGQSLLSYPAFLGNFEGENPQIGKTLLNLSGEDFNNFLSLLGVARKETFENPQDKKSLSQKSLQKRLRAFFEFVSIKQLKTRSSGWIIPQALLPSHAKWEVFAIMNNGQVVRVLIPQKKEELLTLKKTLEEQGLTIAEGNLSIDKDDLYLTLSRENEKKELKKSLLTLGGGSSFFAKLDKNSIDKADRVEDLLFECEIFIQGNLLKGAIPYKGLEIASVEAQNSPMPSEKSPFWVYNTHSSGKSSFILPKDPEMGEGILLPRSFREGGVLAGDRGSLSYFSPTASILQEQLIPIYVAGFYDPGIIPIGGKYILASQEITSLIRASHQQDDKSAVTNGINVRFDRLDKANDVKAQLQSALNRRGIARYWNIETYREYEFTKEIMGELESQKNLFLIIAVVIILVACSNIISMLIILVNDKKMEIGILRSMGASSKSIALIFGLAGGMIGIIGSFAGIFAALFTLHHLDSLIKLLSKLQGHEMFNANLYGQILPHELSLEALSFVLICTVCLSLLAGIVPAIKACLLRPSHILRSGG